MHLYIHIPFCKQACHYCDFHFSTSLKAKKEIITSICNEIRLQKDYLADKNLETVYFGGGTPSILNEEDLAMIFETISHHFNIKKDAEITLEANPDDLTKEKLQLFKKYQINRLSIGIQSFNENHLKSLNRVHNAHEAESCVKYSQDLGIENISIDLIYAIPAPDHLIWEDDLAKATSLGINHISAYSLTIEPQTVFGKWLKQGKIQAIDDEFAARQFEMLIDTLAAKGYEQYEISNFASESLYSRHNTSYWKQEEYLGVGPSAHSFNGSSRQYNISNNALYVKSIFRNEIPAEVEMLSIEDKVNEYLLTGLRTKWGVNLSKIDSISGKNFQEIQKETLSAFRESNFLQIHEGTIKLTSKGKLFADRIASDLFLV
ncbi:oxygen-independent coproporphyrinogen-3 oxidase [Pseudarcicella hirudinis]|uniref:Heme chaperone HemW n=2 Tax=Pseudarcicella hirudinis TaxID=1079859 RepID=A0A1I5PNP8_9BACT|nr:radical SAM family heme chaperone HemW [Pseudarcicella hirudinis]SFP35141.1 oxygen-independent coproporphyrinogen-3 oxidase [Pseudarcicella hirudinis]